MKFQLDFSIQPPPEKISYKDSITLIGSCFAENIGEKFSRYKFHSLTNPYGIVFNPISISKSISEILLHKKYVEADLIFQNGIYHSLNHHSDFSSSENSADVIQKINAGIESAHVSIKKAAWLIVTFGSAYAYTYKRTNEIVANCHKIPNNEFEKVFLKPGDIISDWEKTISELKKFNPGLKIIFTVSPVRYIRDGLIENNKSKAALLTAVHELCSSGKNCFYFPAYELVNDVLRDYRFFKEDMVHPTAQAIDFVWENFCDVMLKEESKKILSEIASYIKLSNHIPLDSAKQNGFYEKLNSEKELIEKKYPFLNW